MSLTMFTDAIAGDAGALSELERQANVLDGYNYTILHTGSWHGTEDHVQFILRKFADKYLLFRMEYKNQTALHYAAYYGIPEVIIVLIDAARKAFQAKDYPHNPFSSFEEFIRHPNCELDSALSHAVMRNRLPSVQLLVEADQSYGHILNQESKTPMYIAAENGYKDILKVICTTCTAPSVEGPAGSTALHAAILKFHNDTEEDREVIMMIIDAAKRWSTRAEHTPDVSFESFFNRTDEFGQTVLELAVQRNHVNAVELILLNDPAYQHGQASKLHGLMHSIYKAIEKESSKKIVELLSDTYEAGIKPDQNGILAFLLAIQRRDRESVVGLLKGDNKHLVSFVDDKGWTPLHYAAYNESNSVLDVIIDTQTEVGCKFVYENTVATPFHVALEQGYISTVGRLMELWPISSSAYTSINKNGQNILHLAAIDNKKEMIEVILMNCPGNYKDKFLNQKDDKGDTPLHLLVSNGCFILQLIKDEAVDLMAKNMRGWTVQDMLYSQDNIVGDQANIKSALEEVQKNPKTYILESAVQTSKRVAKDVEFKKYAEKLKAEEVALMKEHLEKYKSTTCDVAHWFRDAIAGNASARAALMEMKERNETGETILHVESKKGNVENVRFIVNAFANKGLLRKVDGLNQTALHLAAYHGHTQVVEVLIDAAKHLPSFSANDDTHNPVTPFHAFIRQVTGPKRNTALHLAVLNRKVASVKLLVEAHSDDIYVQDSEGKTPIYIAAENGYKDIVKEICTTCTALCLDGPGGGSTALHVLIQNTSQVTEGESDLIRVMLNAAQHRSSADFEALFSKKDESGNTVLQLAVENNYVDAVELILQADPSYQHGREIKRNGLMCLIYKAIDKKCSDVIIKSLSKAYQAGIDPDHKDVLDLILAMKSRNEDSVLDLLRRAKDLVNFTEDNGWTPLHYAVFNEFDSILGAIIEAQEDVKHKFVYGNLVLTPFHVAVKCGYTSTLVRLMQLWPVLSSASIDDNSPYTVVDEKSRNILHLAAAAAVNNRKEMVQGILKYCPEMYKDKILKQQDTNKDTPLHLLISQGCFIPELIIDKGLDITVKNKDDCTPWEMLYFKNDVVADQVKIKIAIDNVQTNYQSAWNFWSKSTEKKIDIWKSIAPSKRRIKDVIFDEHKNKLMDAKHEKRKKRIERYKMRTNTQIIVTALITTVTFTVGFTMPGGLRQSGEVNQGLALLSKKTAFNAFMVSDVLALLLSTSSLFFYFLESMTEDPRQVSKLNAASTVLNIVSVMAMMLTFIAGTYLVLLDSPALAITVCIIGSLFFFLIIILLIKIVYDRLVIKMNFE